MPKKTVVILSVISVSLGVWIFLLSLLIASPAYRVDGEIRVNRFFYIDSEILPDHIFYPLLNIQDILLLKILPATKERSVMTLDVANRRLEKAIGLHQKDPQSELIIVTVDKSHSYFMPAVEQLLALNKLNEEELTLLNQLFEIRAEELKGLGEGLIDNKRSRIDEIWQEERVEIEKLRSRYPWFYERTPKNEMSILRQQPEQCD